MNNYTEQKTSENVLGKKKKLVHEAINDKKLSKHEIISRMFNGLVEEIESVKKCLFEELKVTNKSKEKAESIGFKFVFSGPLVRSSYLADIIFEKTADNELKRIIS